ncbi:amidohydrolase family protein [Anaerofustis stercorihominis DSM 17244]|uniref:Amidohydrolase family protein n=1 Tax=Anaerofustis stercorihominis DSM 17244 TaxID=445971 RepID=B1C8V8_9FIRM|nr:amidohydrolase family protein [Anaerofustis stercorihominis]EDS72018.1 amidohydrolase family protein [Anaerofustis stercorihominis DSM 17244]
MVYDIIIENGTLIDPLYNIHQKGNIYIINDKIVSPPKDNEKIEYKQKIDASGHYVIPGLVENHTHIYNGGGDPNLNADVIMLPSGVTSAIDQGSSGWSNFNLFFKSIIMSSMMNIKCYLNVSNSGLITEDYFENIDPKYFNKEMLKFYTKKYKDTIIGLKIRLCRDSIKDMGLKPLEKTIELAEELNLPVSVHIKDLDEIKEAANMLRKGDIWVHMYQQTGPTILDNQGKVINEVLKAKERGVLFDVASGRGSFSFDTINKAFKCGLKPDLLGTDLVAYNVYQRPIFSIPYTMSIYLNLGMSIDELLKICIKNPAEQMNLSGKIDTLKENTTADICIMEIKEKDITFNDKYGGRLNGSRLIVPKMTIKDGKVVYRNIEF